MKKVIFAILVLSLSGSDKMQQADISGVYQSGKNSRFFPSILCMNNDGEFTYIIDLNTEHEDKSFHLGSYRVVADTLFLDTEYEGLNDSSLIKTSYSLKAIIDDKAFKMLNPIDGVYVELKLTKKRKVLSECEKMRLIANQ